MCLSTLRERFESRSDVSPVGETARQGRATAAATAVAGRLTESLRFRKGIMCRYSGGVDEWFKSTVY